jgi:hypothetical protein
MRIVSLDPGGTTGVCEYESSGRGESFNAWQLEGAEHHATLYNYLVAHNPDLILCEDFIYEIRNKNKYAAAAIVLVSRDYIGVTKLYGQLHQKTVLMRPPGQGFTFWSEAKIKKLGLWKTNAPHAMDATRHLLDHLVHNLSRRDLLHALK